MNDRQRWADVGLAASLSLCLAGLLGLLAMLLDVLRFLSSCGPTP